ncbi:hypothetical protein B0H14DRAFT_2644353 [Mycena olivaceomarginata]|nr:hypothetical protein B0H14DRAFT_2644353 [Mycena olivaceomarginata]
MATIDNQKELTMVIASGKILRVSNVLGAGYRNGAGTKGLIDLCRRAANGEYKPINDEREKALAVALWRVGGGRLAQIGHRALGPAGLNTLRRNTVIRPLLLSAGRPRIEDIEYNIDACLDGLPEEPDDPPSNFAPGREIHESEYITWTGRPLNRQDVRLEPCGA